MIAIKNYEEVGEARLNRAKAEVNRIFKNKLELDKLKDQEQYIEIDEINKRRRSQSNKTADEFLKSAVAEVKRSTEILELADKFLLARTTTTTKAPITTTTKYITGDKELREYIEKILKVKNNIKNLLQKFKRNLNLYNYFDKIDVNEIRSELQNLDNINKNLFNKFSSQIMHTAINVEDKDLILSIIQELNSYVEEIYNLVSGGGSRQEHFIKVGGSKLYNTSITLDNYKYV